MEHSKAYLDLQNQIQNLVNDYFPSTQRFRVIEIALFGEQEDEPLPNFTVQQTNILNNYGVVVNLSGDSVKSSKVSKDKLLSLLIAIIQLITAAISTYNSTSKVELQKHEIVQLHEDVDTLKGIVAKLNAPATSDEAASSTRN